MARRTSDRLRDDLTPQEAKVWNWLRDHLHPVGWKFRRQVRIGRYVVDFASLRPRIVIEIDGDDHEQPVKKAEDAERDAVLVSQGFVVIRFSNYDIGKGGDAFVDALLGEVADAGIAAPTRPRRPAKDPSPQGEVAAQRPEGVGLPQSPQQTSAGGTGLSARCDPSPGFAGPSPEGRDFSASVDAETPRGRGEA